MKISFYADNSVKQIGLGGDFELIITEDFVIDEFNNIDANGNRKYLYFPDNADMTCEVVLNPSYQPPVIIEN